MDIHCPSSRSWSHLQPGLSQGLPLLTCAASAGHFRPDQLCVYWGCITHTLSLTLARGLGTDVMKRDGTSVRCIFTCDRCLWKAHQNGQFEETREFVAIADSEQQPVLQTRKMDIMQHRLPEISH
jgi:hypothetical protein